MFNADTDILLLVLGSMDISEILDTGQNIDVSLYLTLKLIIGQKSTLDKKKHIGGQYDYPEESSLSVF